VDDLKEGEGDELLGLELATCPYKFNNRLYRLIAHAQLRRTPIHQYIEDFLPPDAPSSMLVNAGKSQ
jgi:hypothetical protein